MISEKRYVSYFFFFFEISFRYIEMDRLLDAEVRGIQDLRVEIEDVVGELTRRIQVSTRRKDIRYRLLVQVDEKLSRFRRWTVSG